MMLPNTVSSHRVIGILEGQHAQLVSDDLIAFHAEEMNSHWLAIELAQPTIDNKFTDWQYDTATSVVKQWSAKYNFPPNRLCILGHEETAQGIRNHKSDPGYKWDWNRWLSTF